MRRIPDPSPSDQVLTVAQMRAAEQASIDAGSSVDALMQLAGRGAADWVWRVAAHHKVTVLCGPGNNGGDGYVIAEALRERGGSVTVVAVADPATEAARKAAASYGGQVLPPEADAHGDVLVDCLFGSGLKRPLHDEYLVLLQRLSAAHRQRIAIDLPSGIEGDTGRALNQGLPSYDFTLALGAWKPAHFLMPGLSLLGDRRLVDIGVGPVADAARRIARPRFSAPAVDAHKYRRGLLAVVGGAMPGAAVLAARAAQHAGAGYVKLFADQGSQSPADLVVDTGRLSRVLTDHRNTAILVGPGLGRDPIARERLATAMADPVPAVLDADALHLMGERLLAERLAPTIATPHEGELAAVEAIFGLEGGGSKADRAQALAERSGMVVVAKGPDTVVAAPDGRFGFADPATSWLSTAGTGDVLAGVIASRVASGAEPFAAACEGVWLHGEAARLSGPAFGAGDLVKAIPLALASCL